MTIDTQQNQTNSTIQDVLNVESQTQNQNPDLAPLTEFEFGANDANCKKNHLSKIIISNSYAGPHIGVIPMNGNVGITGPNGDGKTTPLKLVALFMGGSPWQTIWHSQTDWRWHLGAENKLIAYEYTKCQQPTPKGAGLLN